MDYNAVVINRGRPRKTISPTTKNDVEVNGLLLNLFYV